MNSVMQVDNSDVFIPAEKQMYDNQGKEVFAGQDTLIRLELKNCPIRLRDRLTESLGEHLEKVAMSYNPSGAIEYLFKQKPDEPMETMNGKR